MIRLLVFVMLSLPLIGVYAIFGLGIVAIYRASRVLNLAHGAMAMLPAYLVYSLTRGDLGTGPKIILSAIAGIGAAGGLRRILSKRLGKVLGTLAAAGVGAVVTSISYWLFGAAIPLGVAVPISIIAGGALGVGIERVFVKPLRGVSTTAQTVGTVAAFGLIFSGAAKIWGTGGLQAASIFPEGFIRLGSSGVRYGEIGLFLVMLVVAGSLFALLQYTSIGLAMRGAADNRRAAVLMGIDADLATSGAWVLGGVTAAIGGILLASVTTLHPLVLALQAIPAFVAVLIGGLESLPGALIGAAIIGTTQGLVPALEVLRRIEGTPQLLLAVLALVVMGLRGERLVATDVRKAEI